MSMGLIWFISGLAIVLAIAAAIGAWFLRDSDLFLIPFALAVFCVLALTGGIIFSATSTTSAIVCRNTARNMELPHRWALTTGCMLRYQGRWWPKDQLRVIQGVP